jgi:uncharacterized HAD superfamily protein
MNIQEILTNVHSVPSPSIGIDLDGTIDESPVFFSLLTNLWPGQVYIITYRNDLLGIANDLAKYNIKYTDIITVNSFPQKAKEIDRLGISVFFDDMDEVLKHIKSNVTVLKIRNEGNFDYDDKRWVYSEDTGRQI